jgi:hypothetical protein
MQGPAGPAPATLLPTACSLPAVIKGKPKATVEAVMQLLAALLPKLDPEAQVGASSSGAARLCTACAPARCSGRRASGKRCRPAGLLR